MEKRIIIIVQKKKKNNTINWQQQELTPCRLHMDSKSRVPQSPPYTSLRSIWRTFLPPTAASNPAKRHSLNPEPKMTTS